MKEFEAEPGLGSRADHVRARLWNTSLLTRTYADDTARSAELARSFVAAKIANCRRVLQRTLRDHSGKTDEPKLEGAMLLWHGS